MVEENGPRCAVEAVAETTSACDRFLACTSFEKLGLAYRAVRWNFQDGVENLRHTNDRGSRYPRLLARWLCQSRNGRRASWTWRGTLFNKRWQAKRKNPKSERAKSRSTRMRLDRALHLSEKSRNGRACRVSVRDGACPPRRGHRDRTRKLCLTRTHPRGLPSSLDRALR